MPLLQQPVDTSSQSDVAIFKVQSFLLSKVNLVERVGKGIRKAFDEVIDGPRTGRYRIEQLEKTEKTYIGTKIEIVLRNELALPRGKILDNLICGNEVDTKFSLSGNWMIPREAIGQICLLIEADDNNKFFSMGLLRTSPEVLTCGSNQDGKKSVSAAGKLKIIWLFHKETMPENFLLTLNDYDREFIMSKKNGVQRVSALFTRVTGRIIPRTAVEQVAQQKDPLRRARQMKKLLFSDGYKVLCAKYLNDKQEFYRYGFREFKDDDWLSINIKSS